MDKIMKTVEIKQRIREKELMEADNSDLENGDDDNNEGKEKVVKKVKQLEKIDPFFASLEDETGSI